MYFAKKTGIIGDNQKLDVNKFLNQQIEDLYLKIEREIMLKEKDIKFMHQKADELEVDSDDEITEEQQRIKMEAKRKKRFAKLKEKKKPIPIHPKRRKFKYKKTEMCKEFL